LAAPDIDQLRDAVLHFVRGADARSPTLEARKISEAALSSGDDLTDAEVAAIKARMSHDLLSPTNIALLSPLTMRQREEFARRSHTVVVYLGDEVSRMRAAEEQAAMSAAPPSHDLSTLIGLNIGAGDRLISPYLLPVDIMRKPSLAKEQGVHARLTASSLLALSDNLPFKANTIDYIVALHMLEHVEDPAGVIRHWLDIIKPGGGIGLVLPDWRYTWDARKDRAPFGHKWNSTPELLEQMFKLHWRHNSNLELIGKSGFAGSFHLVLRKHGAFSAFAPPDPKRMKSGFQRFQEGTFLQEG
jgi:SAM-dependent methyltransferase